MKAHSAKEYANQLAQLLPPGLAWTRLKNGVLDGVLDGMSEEFARAEARAIYLSLYEFYAQTTLELLPEWEFEYGLPDPCTQLGETYEERIENLLRKIRSIGGQSVAYYVGLAKALGIEIWIEEFAPFQCGLSCAGDGLYDERWLHVFMVHGPAVRVYYFCAGASTAGEALRHWRGNEVLECVINRLKPAHTYAIFSYEEIPDVLA